MKKSPLTPEQAAELQHMREFIEQGLASDAPEHRTAAERLALLQLLFDQKKFGRDQIGEISAMGVLLGDALVSVLNLEWCSVEDELGTDLAVAPEGKNIFSFPLSVIHRRYLEEDNVNLFYTFVGIAEAMTTRSSEADATDNR
jgi:hypothetical protein